MLKDNVRKEGEIHQVLKPQLTLKPQQPTESMVKFMNMTATTIGKFNLKEQALVTKIQRVQITSETSKRQKILLNLTDSKATQTGP